MELTCSLAPAPTLFRMRTTGKGLWPPLVAFPTPEFLAPIGPLHEPSPSVLPIWKSSRCSAPSAGSVGRRRLQARFCKWGWRRWRRLSAGCGGCERRGQKDSGVGFEARGCCGAWCSPTRPLGLRRRGGMWLTSLSSRTRSPRSMVSWGLPRLLRVQPRLPGLWRPRKECRPARVDSGRQADLLASCCNPCPAFWSLPTLGTDCGFLALFL